MTLSEVSDRGATREDLVAISVTLLESMGDVVEQGNSDLRRAIEKPRSRPVVRLDELSVVVESWLSGESLEGIFGTLPSNLRSKRQPGLSEWLGGVTEDSTWTDHFAKFHDFMTECVAFFLPWILRAAQPLAELDEQAERPWGEWGSVP